nr:hypothetical protein [Tanacetum cinerariifolium]
MTFTSTHKSMTPRAVLLKSGTKPINIPFSTARPTLKSAQPKMTSFVKTTHSNVKRPFERKSTAKNKVWSPTVRPKIPTVGSKVPTAKPTVAADKGNKGKVVKASARWIWKPKQTSSGQGLNFNGVSVTFKKYQYIDTQGRLKSLASVVGFELSWDWSYMAEEDEASKNHALVANEEEVPTEYALMAKSSSSSNNEVYDDSFCYKSCRKNTENLNTKISKLNEELSDYETDLVLERDRELKDNKIEYLMNKLEEVKKEKESIDFKIEKFENASKDLDKLLGSQKLDKDKKGVGFNEYCVVPPPLAQVYSPPNKDLSWMGLPEIVDDTVTDYTRPTPRGSSGNVVSKPMIKFVKESGCPNATKVNNTENARKPIVKYAEMYRNTSQSPRVRGNQRN